MNVRDDRAAWASFWSESGGRGGCLAGAPRQVDAALQAIWKPAAESLPKGARVLDLASGDGVVPALLARSRSGLTLVGVDSSPVLPPPPRGVRLAAGIAMEALPFPDDNFDLVTSQFGFEYGTARQTALEVARVLRPGGGLTFVLHHADSAIVVHNAARRQALEWATGASGLLGKAKAFARTRAVAALPTPATFRLAPDNAARRFPTQSVASEFVTAILQTLNFSRGEPPAASLEALATLEARAGGELARLAALGEAALNEEKRDAIVAELATAGLVTLERSVVVALNDPAPIAWLVKATKP